MNKFVFEHVDFENLSKLVYNRYIQKTSSSKTVAGETTKKTKRSGGTKIITEKCHQHRVRGLAKCLPSTIASLLSVINPL